MESNNIALTKTHNPEAVVKPDVPIDRREINRFLSDKGVQELEEPLTKLLEESYVSTEGFLKSFDDCVLSFDKDIKDTPWILIIPNKKGVGGSNDWCSERALSLVKNKPKAVFHEDEENRTLRRVMEDNGVKNLAIFDDAIYRGDQMNGLLDRMELLGEHPKEEEPEDSVFNSQLFTESEQTKFNIVVPFISNKWLTKKLEYGAHLRGDLENNEQLQKYSRISATKNWGKQLFIYTQNAVPTFLEKIKLIGNQGNELFDILMSNWSEGGYTMIDVHEHALTLWFEHRVPDRDSSPFAQFAEKKPDNKPPKYLFFKKGRQLWNTRT